MKRRGFTLIELLVVISIIALLSSVVVGSLNAAREKARVSAVRAFASQAARAAGEAAVAVWDFDECSGTSAGDRSGFGNAATLVNGPTWSTNTPSGAGCSISLDGSNDYLTTGFLFNDSTYSQSIWVYVNSIGGGFSILGNDDGSYDGHSLYVASNGRPYIHNCHPNACNDVNSNTALATGKWTHVAVSVDAGVATFYIDGKHAGGGSGVENFGTNWQIGANGHNGMVWSGLIDEARIFAKPLTASEAGAIYAAGAASHGLAAN